jgi:hypothetical protein
LIIAVGGPLSDEEREDSNVDDIKKKKEQYSTAQGFSMDRRHGILRYR